MHKARRSSLQTRLLVSLERNSKTAVDREVPRAWHELHRLRHQVVSLTLRRVNTEQHEHNAPHPEDTNQVFHVYPHHLKLIRCNRQSLPLAPACSRRRKPSLTHAHDDR